MKHIHLAITLAICSACFCSAGFIAPQIVSASGWGNVFDPTRYGKNVLIYEEKLKSLGIDTKIYANMALRIAKLAGVDTAKNETMKHLEEYANSKENPLDFDKYMKDFTQRKLGQPFNMNDIVIMCDGDKETNAKMLEALRHDGEQQSKLEKTVSVLLQMKSDGTLGELQKGNFLEGLSTSQKLQKINSMYRQISKDIQDQQSEMLQEREKDVENAKLSQMKIVDPYDSTEKGDKEKELYNEAVEHLPDAFGEKGYKTSDFGFLKF